MTALLLAEIQIFSQNMVYHVIAMNSINFSSKETLKNPNIFAQSVILLILEFWIGIKIRVAVS